MKTTCSILVVLTALAAGAQTRASSRPVIAAVDATKTGPPVSPYVYGQFLEHIGSLIYNSLWSEMLDDRKFYYAVTNKPAENPDAGQREFGPGRRRGVGPGRWNPIGPVDSVVMDPRHPFVGDHTPLITLAGEEPRGIGQTGINFTQGTTYNGRAQLAGDPTAQVAINIVWGTNTDAVRQVVPLGALSADYKKFAFSFKAEK
ncbi:MAG TPA: alpha-N-arabinofuranosidase, partial [Verrucomicrobiae bacterium]|nr:alpha-N-arabinofuranosidase [Verrucomicrobiae bacterium]